MSGTGYHRVFVDSNVFYSRTMRDWIGLLYVRGETSPFHVLWSEDVLADVLHHLRKKHPDWDGAAIAGVHDKIARTFEVGRVDDYVVDGSYGGADPDDAHVHAAAVRGRADILLTCNVKDFVLPDDQADLLTYEVYTPDDFFVLVDDSFPAHVCGVAHQQADYFFRKNGSADLPGRLRKANCPVFAERVRIHLQSFTP